MKRSFPLLFGIAAAIVALDQWSKRQASMHLAFREPVRVVGDFVRLTYARNSGIAFSLFAGRGLPLWIFSVIAAIAVVALFARRERLSPWRQLALALILGGAVGNLIDRATTGMVVDFILLSWGRHEFPVFNVADAAVSAGVTLFALTWAQDDARGDTVDAPPAPAGDGGDAGDGAGQAPGDPVDAHDGTGAHEQAGGADGAGPGSGAAGGPLAREGADRPVA